jgi:hypothetical protein
MLNLFKPNVKKLKIKKNIVGLLKAIHYEKDQSIQILAAQALWEVDEKVIIDILYRQYDYLLSKKTIKYDNNPHLSIIKELIDIILKGLEITDNQKIYEINYNYIRTREGDFSKNSKKMKMFVGFFEDTIKTKEFFRQIDSLAMINIIETLDQGEVEEIILEDVDDLAPLIIRGDFLFSRDFFETIKEMEAVDILISGLDSKNLRTRQDSANALGQIKDKRAIESLGQAIKNEDSRIWQEAAEALAKICDKRPAEPLIEALGWGRIEIVRSLGKIGDKEAAEPVIILFFDHSKFTELRPQLSEKHMKNLFEDYTLIILNIMTQDEIWINSLCGIHTGISNNLLYLITQIEDYIWEHIDFDDYGIGTSINESVSYVSLRNKAKIELIKRGNPDYDPSAWNESWVVR